MELNDPADVTSQEFNDLVRSFYDKLSTVAVSMVAPLSLKRYFSEAARPEHLHVIVEFPPSE
jgi:hypothetical protein